MKHEGKIISEEEALELKRIFDKCLQSYEEKSAEESDKEWLAQLLLGETSRSTEDALYNADEIINSIEGFEENFIDVEDAEQKGISKESWLASKIREGVKLLSASEQGKVLKMTQDVLLETNVQVSEELEEVQEEDYNNIVEVIIPKEETYKVEQDLNQMEINILSKDIGKNISTLAVQNAAIATGTKIVNNILKGESIEPKKIVIDAFQTGIDKSLKVVAAGALQVAVDNDIVKALPEKAMPSAVAGIAGMGIENAKTLYMISSGKITMSEGLNRMGKVAVAMFANFWNSIKDTSVTRYLKTFIPVLNPVGAVIADVIGTIISFSGGKNINELLYNTKIKVAKIAKSMAKATVEGVKKVGKYVTTKVTNAVVKVKEIFS